MTIKQRNNEGINRLMESLQLLLQEPYMNEWVDASQELPIEGRMVDVWLERGHRAADCYWEKKQQGKQEIPTWFFRNGFSVWKPFADQDITHWRYKPPGPNGELED